MCGAFDPPTQVTINVHISSVMNFFCLQFDFKSQTLSDIQQGRRAEKIEFKHILSYQSEVHVIPFKSVVTYVLSVYTCAYILLKCVACF